MKLIVSVSVVTCLTISTLISCKKKDDDVPVTEQPVAGAFLDGVSPQKSNLAVFGDSLATGVLANTQLGENVDASLWEQVGQLIAGNPLDADANQQALSNPDLAAATTDKTYGLRADIASSLGLSASDIGVVSLAKFGARAMAMPSMLERLSMIEGQEILKKVDFIFIMIGGNDFCSEETVDEFRIKYQKALTDIRNSHPDAKFIVAPIPGVDQLAAIDFTYGPAVAGIEGEEVTCKSLRQKSCNRVYDGDASQRVQALNAVVEESFNALDIPVERKIFVGGILSWKIKPEELAVECFHPSALGQEAIGSYLKAAFR